MNYEVIDAKGTKLIVNVNRLKKCFDPSPMEVKSRRTDKKKLKQSSDDSQEEERVIRSYPIPCVIPSETQSEVSLEDSEAREMDLEDTSTSQRDISDRHQESVRLDPDYIPSDSPRSRRDLISTPYSPLVTRSRARLQIQGDTEVV